MMNKKIIYFPALFLCLQESVSMEADPPVLTSSRLLDEAGERLSAEEAITLANSILSNRESWPSNLDSQVERLTEYYYACENSTDQALGVIWHCVACYKGIGILGRELILSNDVSSLLYRMTLLEDSPELTPVGLLLQNLQNIFGANELGIILNPLNMNEVNLKLLLAYQIHMETVRQARELLE